MRRQKNNKVNRNERRKEEKIVVDEKTCRSDVCVRENEWRMARATTERCLYTEILSGRTEPYQ